MAQKKNKVSVAAIEGVMKEQFNENRKVFDWYGVEVEYLETLSMVQMVTFVDSVVDSCFDKDGDYISEMKEFLIRTFTVQLYTNVRMPQNIEKQYDIVFGGDLYEVLIQHINKDQYGSMIEAIEDKLRYRVDADIVASRKSINELLLRFEAWGEELSKISADDVKNIAGALNGFDLDEEKLVDAVIAKNTGETETEIKDEENKIISIHEDDG